MVAVVKEKNKALNKIIVIESKCVIWVYDIKRKNTFEETKNYHYDII